MKATSDLEEKDAIRDDLVRDLFFVVQGAAHVPIDDVKSAGQKLMKLLDNYGLSMLSESYATESTLLNSLLLDLAKTTYALDITKVLGCTELIGMLSIAQDDFEAASLSFEGSKSVEATYKNATELKTKLIKSINSELVEDMRWLVRKQNATYAAFAQVVSQIITDNNLRVQRRLAANKDKKKKTEGDA